MLFLFLLLLATSGSHGQFAEIASLATSLLGSGLGGLAGTAGSAAAGAGQAAGALGQIGQLYQLAQGALQLTSTGVGVLNQATEGNWFPAALETAAKNQEAFKGSGGFGGLPMPGLGGRGGGGLMGGLPGLGPLGPAPNRGGSAVGSEFGTSFPAPDIDDYKDDLDILTTPPPTTPKPKDPFEEFEDKDLEGPGPITAKPTAAPTTTQSVTLFPDEEEFDTLAPTQAPKKQIRIELPKENKEEEDYIDQVRKEEEAVVEITNREKKDGDELLLPARSLPSVDAKTLEENKDRKVPNLEKLVDTLRQKSTLTEEEIQELIGQVEGNRNVEKPPKIDFNSGVRNINDKMADNRKRIIEASRKIDATWRGQPVQRHRLSTVPLPVTAPPTPSPFVYTTTLPSEEILNNRLQREIVAPGEDKDLTKIDKPKVLPAKRPVAPAPTQAPLPVPTTASYVYPRVAVGQPQPQVTQPQLQQVARPSQPIVQQQSQLQYQQVSQPRPQQVPQPQPQPHPQPQPQPQPQLQHQATAAPYQLPQQYQYGTQVQTQQPQQYFYQPQSQQVPPSFPIQQQYGAQAQTQQQQLQQYYQYQQYQNQQPWTQAQYQNYYYQQYPQQYHTQQLVQVSTQPPHVVQQPVQQLQPVLNVQKPQPQPQPQQLYQRPAQAIAAPQIQPTAVPQTAAPQVRPPTPIQKPPPPPPPPQTTDQRWAQPTIPVGKVVEKQQIVPSSHQGLEGKIPTHKAQQANSHQKSAVKNVSGSSTNVYVNQGAKGETFFATAKDTVVRGRRNQIKGTRIHRQSNSTRTPYRRFYPRTARTLPLTTPSPVRGSRAVNQSLISN